MISVAADENAAGTERISAMPTTPTAAIENEIGTRSAISANIAAKPSSASIIVHRLLVKPHRPAPAATP